MGASNGESPKTAKQHRAAGFLAGTAFGVIWIGVFGLYMTNTGRFATDGQAADAARHAAAEYLCLHRAGAGVESVNLLQGFPRLKSEQFIDYLTGRDAVWSFDWTAIDRESRLQGRVIIFADWTRVVYQAEPHREFALEIFKARRRNCPV